MNYKTYIHEGLKTKHVYRYTPEKKINEKLTAMAGVEVFDYSGKKIGGHAFTRSPKNAFDNQVLNMVKEIIRDYEIRKIFNKKFKED